MHRWMMIQLLPIDVQGQWEVSEPLRHSLGSLANVPSTYMRA